jgi:hypothetical protein
LGLRVRDERRSRTFYEQALEPFGVQVVESSRGPGFAIEAVEISGSRKGNPRPLPFMWPSPQPIEPPSTSSTAPLSKPAAVTTARRVFAGITTPCIYAAFVIDPDGNNVEAVFHGDRQLPAT